MINTLLFILTLGFSFAALAQQIGAGAQPLSNQRLGLETGGTVSRGVGTSALVRYLNNLNDDTALELGAGGATGVYGARVLAGLRHQVVKEDVGFPSVYLRAGMDFIGSQDSTRRTAIGGGPLLAQGFVVNGQELYGFLYPRAQMRLDPDTSEFDFITASSFGLNAATKVNGRNVIGSFELDMGFQNAPNAVTVGIATDI